MPTCPTLAPNMTSRTTSGRKLQQKYRPCRLRRLQGEFLENGLGDDHQISQDCRGPLAPQISSILCHSLLLVSCKMQLNTAQKWCVKRLSGQRVKNFGHCLTQTLTCCTDIHADVIYCHTVYDVTGYFWSAFMEVWKTAENAASDGFYSNFNGTAFCLPHQMVGTCWKFMYGCD